MRLDPEPGLSHVEFTVRVLRHGRHPVLELRGEIDRATVSAFATAMDAVLHEATSIELHLADLTFTDSSALRILYEAQLRLGQLPEAIVLVDVRPEVRRALRLVGIEQLFTIHPTSEPVP